MDYKTKEYYRNRIKEISEKTKISEIYIVNKALELANIKVKDDLLINDKQSHIGYYLISDGFPKLMQYLGQKTSTFKKIDKNMENANLYINSIFYFTLILVVVFGIYINYLTKNVIQSIVLSLVAYIPISEIYIQILNYILNKKVKPKLIPKLNLENGVPEELATFVVIPTIIKDKEKVKEMVNRLEVYYLANKSDNLYFALLGDVTSSKNEIEDFDEEIINTGIDEVEKLNMKYGINSHKFYFLYRNRKWNNKESCYMGWERKRGLLNEFNDFLITCNNSFRVNTIKKVPNIKYVITLDADTKLVLNTGLELIGAMAHILNIPQIDENKNIVISGHGIIQPRVGIDLLSSRKSLFTKIYAGRRWNRFIY